MKQIYSNTGINQSESKSDLRAITPTRSVLASLKADVIMPITQKKEELKSVLEENPLASY
jgi:hypothetical protein